MVKNTILVLCAEFCFILVPILLNVLFKFLYFQEILDLVPTTCLFIVDFFQKLLFIY